MTRFLTASASALALTFAGAAFAQDTETDMLPPVQDDETITQEENSWDEQATEDEYMEPQGDANYDMGEPIEEEEDLYADEVEGDEVEPEEGELFEDEEGYEDPDL
ncbi:hypothetical protein [Parvularcula oceani]|uniref:hypothetical protein n=1 Tax=Parvularcula oceani TaxID=1247963 RepID=UPI0004E193F8|nr:hypothetical protein [Parvularcula oceani]